jgi:outer membrane protein
MWSIAFVCIILPVVAHPQRAPQVLDRPWDSNRAESGLHAGPGNEPKLDPAHIYVLAELIDLAELSNPATREAWAFAKGRAARLGVSRSDLYPTLVASALGASKDGALINENFALQTIGEYDLPSASLIHFSTSASVADTSTRTVHIFWQPTSNSTSFT